MDKKYQSIFDECVKNLSKSTILYKAYRNEEKPFGCVIDYIKDVYGLSKTEGWSVAESVCKHILGENYVNEVPTRELVYGF